MKHLIVGFCAAGVNAAEAIRKHDPQAEIAVLNGERHPFYLRLDIEGIFHGKPVEQLTPRPPEYWRERGIHVLQDRAKRILSAQHKVETASGRTLDYDRLLIAVGAKPRELDIPGHNLKGVFHYHTLDDALAIQAVRDRVQHAVIIGGGILGLELAHAACAFGWKITILVRGGHIGSPIADPGGGALVLSALKRAGVSVLFHEETAVFEGANNQLTAVRTKSGQVIACDFAAICAGVLPDTRFLQDTSLLQDNYVAVNNRMQTSVPGIFAAGDCAVVRRTDDRLIFCSTWNVASSQARTAAANMIGIDSVWKDDVLYNLDQLFNQEFALIGPWDDRRLPDRTIHEFSTSTSYHALVTRGGVLESAFLLGDRSLDRRIRKLVAARVTIEKNIEKIFDPDYPLEDLLKL